MTPVLFIVATKRTSRTFVCLMKNGWKVEQNLQFSDIFELFSFGFCLFLLHFLFPEYANAEQSVTSHQTSDVERSNLFLCFYWLDLQTYSVCVDVSQQPLGDRASAGQVQTCPGSQTFQTQEFLLEPWEVTAWLKQSANVFRSCKQASNLSCCWKPASQKERWRKSLFLGSQEMSRFFVLQ